MFGQSLLSGAFGTALVPDENFGINLYTGTGANQTIGGKIKGAASFNGSNSVINILSPIGQASSNENDDFTSSIWVKYDAITSSAGGFNGAIIGNGAGSIYAAFALYTYGHASGLSLAMERYFNNTGYYNSSWTSAAPFTAVINTWYHIATTYVGSTKTVTHYVDGTALPSYTLDTNAGSRTMNPNLGLGSYNGSSSGLDGQLDQLRIFNTILTPSQISSLATETAATAGTLNFPAGAGCLAAYQFDTNFNTILSQDDLSTVNFPSGTTGAALYQFENSPNGDAGPNPTTTTNLTYVDGAFGKAVDFNGSSSVWQSTNQIIDSQQSFTISMWIKMDAYNGSSQYLWTSYATGDWGISFGQKSPYDRYVSFHKWNSAHGGGLSIDAPDVTTLGQWYHVCGTFSTTTGMVLYINGASVATSSTTWTGINHGAYSDSIGCYGGTWTGSRSNFTGQIDQFRAYQQTLTAAQVLELAKGEPKYNGGSTTANLNGWVNFKPDLTWIKKSIGGTSNHLLQNTVNGPGTGTSLSSNSTAAAGNFDQYGYLSSFNEQGFTTQGGSSGSYPYDNLGESGSTYISWNWKAGGTAVQNNDGSINGTNCMVSANVDAGFSIVKWTGSTSSSSQSVGHGLGKSPELVILKNIDAVDAWYTYAAGATGNNQYLKLNTTDAVFTAGSDSWGAGPTSSVMGLRPGTFSGSISNNIIMYCWVSIPKYSKIGLYSGNDGTNAITGLGFTPGWVLIKCIDTGGTNWQIWDSARTTGYNLFPNLNSAEVDNSSTFTGFTADGFTVTGTSQSANASGSTYLYMAFA